MPQRRLGVDLQLLLQVGLAVLLLVVAVLVGRRLLRAWRQRRPGPTPSNATAPARDEDSPSVLASLSERRSDHLQALRTGGPRNAIVACWLDLEQAVQRSGLPTRPSETSAELTQRVLASLAVEPQSVRDLGRLYRQARFSTHELGEDHRQAAVRAVQQLHTDLAAVSGSPAGASPATVNPRTARTAP